VGPILTIVMGGSAALYTLSAVSHIFYMVRREFDQMARWSTRAAWMAQSLGLLVMLIHTGRAPVYSLIEFSYFFTWFLMSNYIIMEVMRDSQAAGSFLMPVVAAVQIATLAIRPAGPQVPLQMFSASLIGWHVGVIMLGYGFFFASFTSGALYLVQERNLRLKRWGSMYYRMPSLEQLDIWGGRYVYIGFPLLTIGMVAGFIFAGLSWHTFWQADPKVLFSELVWLVYGGYLLMRKVWGWGGRKAAWWTVAGLAGLLINYFVMSMLSSVHRYGV
jgi:ABC-type transport system involved in cytochrome c biogenesis permease subunit